MKPIEQLALLMNSEKPVDDIERSTYNNIVGNGAAELIILVSQMEEVLRENISQMSMPLAGETGFWYLYELSDQYQILLKFGNKMKQHSKKSYGNLPSHLKSCLAMMLLSVLDSFRLGNIWQEGVKKTQMSAWQMFTLDKLVQITARSETLATALLAVGRDDREDLDTRGQMLALNNAVSMNKVHEIPVIFVSAYVMSLLYITMNVRSVPSSVSARNTMRALEKFNVLFPQLFRSCGSIPTLVNRSHARVGLHTERDMLLAAACLSWINGIERNVEVVFAIDEEISQMIKRYPCLVEVAALTQKKMTCCVYSALVEMLVNAVKLYFVDSTLTITKLYAEYCRRNKILKEFIKVSNFCKDWLKCLENVSLRSIGSLGMTSENAERPTMYPYSMEDEKSLKWHLKYDEAWKNNIEFASNFMKSYLSEKPDRGKDIAEEVREYLAEVADENTKKLNRTNSSQVICTLRCSGVDYHVK